jgi:predicted RNA binding protein YcfA (HicA-like mRNA interferase family)
MSRLPSLTSRDVVAALKRAGFRERRQRGSHLLLHGPDGVAQVIIPVHARELPRGTLKSILSASGLSEDEFLSLL